jgi:Xaa-Pro aminopeptidase
MNYKGRLGRAIEAMRAVRAAIFIVTHPPNIRYLCGFSGSAGVLVLTERQTVLFTDGRYRQQAQEEVHGARVCIGRKSALLMAADWLPKHSPERRSGRRIGIEAAHLSVADRNSLSKALTHGFKLVATVGLIERIRGIKDADEVSRIRKACHLAAELFQVLIRAIRPGVSEAQVAGELEFTARKAGAEQMSFPTIIAGGTRSALPHGRASNAPIPSSGFVVCDFGVILAGYCSDMTRTVHVGQPATVARQGYEAVREAQQAAIEAVRPGVTVGEVDGAARKLLSERGLAKFFTHSTGHGVGLEIHEAPRVAAGQKEVLQSGMVITIEPGVYIPGKWGVRIEDTVVVTETGCEILTPCPKDLITV